LQVNESNLTGEPVVRKTTNEAEFDLEATYSSNLVMRGTTVVDGHGMMKVIKVGDATEKVRLHVRVQNKALNPLL
jgi:Ca2+-transporting ATPase